MEKRKMLMSVTYESDSETKSEIHEDENSLIDYLEDMIESDIHERFGKITLKKIRL